MKKIESGSPAVKGLYIRIVLRRSDRVINEVSLYDWIKLTALEFLFGEELLEQLVVTAAYNEKEKSKLGHLLHLTDMVPSGILTNYFRSGICQLLYYKYYRHYLFLGTEADLVPATRQSEAGDTLLLQRDRFGMRHELLNQVIAFRRVYILAWTLFNITIDVAVWATADLMAALVSALSIEAIRRLLRL